jgi:hypothetical protein
MHLSWQALFFTLVLFLFIHNAYADMIQTDSTHKVEILNFQVQPPTIKVGDTFAINATIVNNSQNSIYVQALCEDGLFSVIFDTHVAVIDKGGFTCTGNLVSLLVDPSEKTTTTSPSLSSLVYRATAAGTAHATVTFTYFIKNQTDHSQSEIWKTVSKSFLFTISDNNTGTKTVNENVLSPLKQFKSGIKIQDIVCKQDLTLLVSHYGLPVCVTPDTAQKLVEHGWTIIVKSSTPTSCPSGQTMANGPWVTCIPVRPTFWCSTGYIAIQISPDSYSCQPTNPPPLSNPTAYLVGQKVGVFTISTINPYNVTGYYNSPYPIGRPGLGDFTIMHLGDTLNPTCDGSAPLVITAINYPNSITVSIGKSMGRAYHGCPVCLSANSVIKTPNSDVNVKDIKDGMTVWSTDSNGIIIKSKVIKINHVFVGDTHKVIDLQLADGRELFVSPNHPTYDGRIIADLKVGETYDGSTVKSIELVPYKYQFTYDILPDTQTGNYWANGILVGSTLK